MIRRGEKGLEEDWNMEVEEEVENKKNSDEQRRRLQKQLCERLRNSRTWITRQREKWKDRLLEIEEKRNELLAEH